MLHTDDELAAVNAEFLGPTGFTLPWRARYVAYGVGSVLFLVDYLILKRLGWPGGLTGFLVSVALVVAATRTIGQFVTHEVPLGALLVMLWHEVSTARRPAPAEVVLFPGLVRTARPEPAPTSDVLDDETDRATATAVLDDAPVSFTALCQTGLHDICHGCDCSCHQ